MAQTCYNGVNNILVYNSGNDSKGMTAGVKYLFYLCNYIKKNFKVFGDNRNTSYGSTGYTYVKNTVRK